MQERPLIAITIGDPAGVGPEVTVKALDRRDLYEVCRPLVTGDPGVVRTNCQSLGISATVAEVSDPAEGAYQSGVIDVLPAGENIPGPFPTGRIDPRCGLAAVEYITKAVSLCLEGVANAMVTAPVNKEAVNRAGIPFLGHTELIAGLCGAAEPRMMLVTSRLRVIHVTTHVALKEVPILVTADRVLSTLIAGHRAVQGLGIARPRIGVAGLNPHAGEGGLFGDEEERAIGPAVETARERGLEVSGPYPPDIVFARGMEGKFDLVVAMYHDQGHIPIKLLGFEDGVNVTAGLPIIRTSVDHGTAFDIAGRGVADPTSMVSAIRLAARMAGKVK